MRKTRQIITLRHLTGLVPLAEDMCDDRNLKTLTTRLKSPIKGGNNKRSECVPIYNLLFSPTLPLLLCYHFLSFDVSIPGRHLTGLVPLAEDMYDDRNLTH